MQPTATANIASRARRQRGLPAPACTPFPGGVSASTSLICCTGEASGVTLGDLLLAQTHYRYASNGGSTGIPELGSIHTS